MNTRHALRILLTLIVTGVICAGSGCSTKATRSSSYATATAGGIRVEARNDDGPVSVQTVNNVATVSISSQQLTIERDRVLVDGAELARLPAGATHVALTAVEGTLTVTADGVPIATKQLGK